MHILILMNFGGGGHASVAQALKEQFEELGHEPTVVNADKFSTANILELLSASYGPISTYTPSAHKQVFLNTDDQKKVKFISRANSLLIKQKFLKYIKKNVPDVIVSVNPLYVGSICLLRKSFPHIPFYVVVTDLVTIHPLWFDVKVDATIVPTEEAFQQAVSAGLSRKRLKQIGLPIRSSFMVENSTKLEARQQLGLPQDKTIIFVGGSGLGAGNIYKIVQELLEQQRFYIVAVAGKNNLLYQQLRLLSEQTNNLSAYKFVDFIAKLMAASDAIVVKPGPTIISEAMTMRVPMVILPTPMYQEQGNLGLAEKHKLGKIVETIPEIVPALDELLSRPYEGQAYQSKDVSRKVAEEILELARVQLHANSSR
jgi:processive 1,2-diacylglycerol beta-glucosyltransferase